MAKKRALIVGINYEGTSSELRGCINDARFMESMLRVSYDFTDIKMLIEKEATTANIMRDLEWLVAGAEPGDVLYFHYSGHGSQMFDPNGDEDDRFDEIICPIDIDWVTKVIRDDDLKRVFDKVPTGVNLTVSLDSCNSGTGLDQTESLQVYGTGAARGDASGRYMAPPAEIAEMIASAHTLAKTREVQSRDVNSSALLISGCQAQQTSADAHINGMWQGAATYAMRTALTQDPKMSYRSLIRSMNDEMITRGFTQRPELNGSKLLYDQPFLSTFAELGVPESPVVAQPAPSDDGKKKDGTNLWVTAAVVAFVLFLVFG